MDKEPNEGGGQEVDERDEEEQDMESHAKEVNCETTCPGAIHGEKNKNGRWKSRGEHRMYGCFGSSMEA